MDLDGNSGWDLVHYGLTIASFCPSVCGSVFSGIDGVVSLAEGDKVGAGIAFAATAVGVVSDAGAAKAAGMAAREGSTTVRSTLAANKAAGRAAEQQAAKDLVAEGNKILGSQVSVRTSEGRRVVDHLIQTPEGKIVACEVKCGGAVRNARQLAKDQAMATEGGVVVGKNAPSELRGTQMVIETIERRY